MVIRRFLLIGLLCCVLSIHAQDQRAIDASTAYQNGDYQSAIMLYEALIEDGIHHANIYFNLGNAYYEVGQPGLALVNYRRAQQLNPRDEQINANITLIRAIRADFQGSETFWIDSLASSTYALMTLQEMAYLSLMLWGIFFIGAAIRIYGKRWITRPLFVVGVMLLLALPLFLTRYYADTYRSPAVVTSLSAPVRSGPSEDYLIMYELFAAAELRVLDTSGDWLRLMLPDGRSGWIERSAVTLIHE